MTANAAERRSGHPAVHKARAAQKAAEPRDDGEGAIILKTLPESLTQYSLESLTAEEHPGDAFDVLKNTFKCALCC